MWWNINKIFSLWIICLLLSTQLIMWSEYSHLKIFVVLYCIFRLKIFFAKVPNWFFSDSKTLFYLFSFLSYLIIVILVNVITIMSSIFIKVVIIIFIIIVFIVIVTFLMTSCDYRFKTWFLFLAWRRRLVIIITVIGFWIFRVTSWPLIICLILWFKFIDSGFIH